MTPFMQLQIPCDADLGGNRDNDHSQTSYLGYLAVNLICWCWRSTDQGSISTSTAESEIKAVNHTLKAEVIANRGILNKMGWEQEPTKIEEDNQAAIYHSKALTWRATFGTWSSALTGSRRWSKTRPVSSSRSLQLTTTQISGPSVSQYPHSLG
jgi:hypothetical protein